MSLQFGGPILFSFLYKVCINGKIQKPVTNIQIKNRHFKDQ